MTQNNLDDPPPGQAAAPLTGRELCWEVLAVLAVGVFPHISSALVSVVGGPAAKAPYWVDAFYLVSSCACISFVVLYLMHRSGEPWTAFGVTAPRISDLLLGPLVFLADIMLWIFVVSRWATGAPPTSEFFPLPQGVVEYALMAVKYAANGFTEELVMRAYLVTRLERLLKSRVKAVVISSVLFTVYHVYYGLNAQLAGVMVTGLVYGTAFVLLRRLWPVALAHLLKDIVGELWQ